MLLLRNAIFTLRNKKIRFTSFYFSSLPQEEKIKFKGYEINYVKVGKGSHHVFCATGVLGTISTDFKLQIEGFNRDKFTLVAWDPPGYGKSRPPEKSFTTDFYENDAVVAYDFMRELNIKKFSLLGWSDGGITSLILASKFPQAVNKLVVWGANTYILPHELEAYKKLRDITTWSKRMSDPMIAIYGEELFRRYWSEWVDCLVTLYNEKKGDICSAGVKNITCPTLILHGDKDPLVDSAHVSYLHTHIRNSRIHLYPDGKHNIHIKYAEDFNKRVQDFLLE